jgi:membrane protein implicated in regulation of membrane protease activity
VFRAAQLVPSPCLHLTVSVISQLLQPAPERSRQRITAPLRVIPWWWALLGAALALALSAVTTMVLLSIAKNDASLRIEAIKTGLTVGAGTGGAGALLLAFRRQWLSEHVAQDSTHDATERRVTELYAKAVEQLGHDKAAVRLGGLYSLERLAQDHHEHRQTVVDVICAYLRMPFEPVSERAAETFGSTAELDAPGPPPRDTDPGESRQELQVRLAAQGLLARHLASEASCDASASPPQFADAYWPGGPRPVP